MKTITRILLLPIFFFFYSSLLAQPMRYFEFVVGCGHNNWQDTSFVACASNQTLIDSVLANLDRPMHQRKFILGPIAAGNGGFNFNASHPFRWHFVPNQWQLVDLAIELCDGCPFTDLDTDTAYWLNTVQSFCPWTSKPVREISAPSSIHELVSSESYIAYPNPASRNFVVKGPIVNNPTCRIYNMLGMAITNQTSLTSMQAIDVSAWEEGIYIIRITTDKLIINKRIHVGKYTEY